MHVWVKVTEWNREQALTLRPCSFSKQAGTSEMFDGALSARLENWEKICGVCVTGLCCNHNIRVQNFTVFLILKYMYIKWNCISWCVRYSPNLSVNVAILRKCAIQNIREKMNYNEASLMQIYMWLKEISRPVIHGSLQWFSLCLFSWFFSTLYSRIIHL